MGEKGSRGRGGRRDPAKERAWRRRLAQYERADLTVRAFCGQEGVQESTFYFWRSELARRDDEEIGGRGGKGDLVDSSDSALVPVHLIGAAASHPIEIRLAGGHVVCAGADVPAEHLAALVHALAAAPC